MYKNNTFIYEHCVMNNVIEESMFVKAFGDSPKIKVIDYAIDNHLFDFSKSDVAEGTGVSRTTINQFFGELVKQKMLVKTRKIGRATLYKLNTKLPFVRKLLEIDYLLSFGKELKIKRAVAAVIQKTL